MKQIISKQEFNELMSIKGEVRGVGIKSYGEYILKEEGKEGLKKLEEIITNLGYPIRWKQIKTLIFYPVGLEGLILLVIQRVFNYDAKKIQEIGEFHLKKPLVFRLFTKYFASLETMTQQAPEAWKQLFTIGNLETIEVNKKKKYIILRLTDFSLRSPHCQIIMGIFSAVLQMLTKSNKVSCEETKCLYRGDEYHEFLLKW